MEGNSGTPMGEEGVGKGVNEIGVIGTVIGPVMVVRRVISLGYIVMERTYTRTRTYRFQYHYHF